MKCEEHYISLPLEVLWVEMIIRDAERLDMLRWCANRDTMGSIMMNGTHGDDSANQWCS